MTEATSAATAARSRTTWSVAWLVAATVLFHAVARYAIPDDRTAVVTLTVGVPYLGAAVGAVAARGRRGAHLVRGIVLGAAWASTAALAATVIYLVVLFVFLVMVLGGL